MKYLKLFESFNSIYDICNKYYIRDYIINKDGSIDVDGFVYLSVENLTKLPLKFNKVYGDFWCDNNEITSLEGSPVELNGDFWCENNKLTSFKGSPRIIREGFNCTDNNIKTFEYFPSYVGGHFYCVSNPIENVWDLFEDTKKIELLNDFDVFRDEDTETPAIVMDRLNDFLLTIGKPEVEKVDQYKNI